MSDPGETGLAPAGAVAKRRRGDACVALSVAALLGLVGAGLWLAHERRGRAPSELDRFQLAVAESMEDDVWADLVDAGDADGLRALLSSGAVDPDGAPGPYRDAPLRYAAMEGQAEIVEVLLDAGADPGQVKPHARSPLGAAASQGHVAIAELLLERGAVPTADGSDLIAAIGGEDRDLIARMLAAGADPNPPREPEEMTPLLWALHTGEPDIVAMLLDAGADPNAVRTVPGDHEWTALRMARHEGFRRIAELLVDAGAVDDDPELTERVARPAPRPPRALEPDVDGGLDPATLEDLRRFLVEPASAAAIESFEEREGLTLPDHACDYLRLSNGLVDLRNYLGEELTMLPVERWRRKRHRADPEELAFWAEQPDWRGIPDAIVVGLSEGDEDELLLRPPGSGDDEGWDLLHLQMPLDGSMTVHPTIQSFLAERVAGLREDGYLEPLPEP